MKNIILALLSITISASAWALPTAVKDFVPESNLIGKSDYSVFFMDVYDIEYHTSITPKAEILHITYHMDLTAKKRLDSFMESLEEQNLNVNYPSWQKTLAGIFPDVKDGDSITILKLGPRLIFFHNDKLRAQHVEAPLAKAFFDVWLGKEADEDMKQELLGK